MLLDDCLKRNREVWRRKEVLRSMYSAWYRLMFEQVRHWGRHNIELGGGIGNLREFDPRIISSDLVRYDWLDLVSDAEALPFQEESVDNIFLFDVLHHIGSPRSFLSQAERALKPGGRIIMVEPYISAASDIVYTHFHSEMHDLSVDPYQAAPRNGKDPWDSNQAYPTLMFWKHRAEFARRFPGFDIVKTERMGFLSYPLSGGFQQRAFLPRWALRRLSRWEACLRPLGGLLAFRCLVVVEKRPKPQRAFRAKGGMQRLRNREAMVEV